MGQLCSVLETGPTQVGPAPGAVAALTERTGRGRHLEDKSEPASQAEKWLRQGRTGSDSFYKAQVPSRS